MSLIVALDTPDLETCRTLLKDLKGLVQYYKIGFELFTAHGWRAVEEVEKVGGKVFLDLKLHDIPNTVSKTARVLAERGVFMFNVHALGGLEMMRQARRAAEESAPKGKRPLLVAVTILTSHDEKSLAGELGIRPSLKEEVLGLARLARSAGLDGVVCSPQEIELLRKEFGEDFILVTPGVRPVGSASQDQKRILTPREARQKGASYLVIGRPITAEKNPRRAAEQILQSLA